MGVGWSYSRGVGIGGGDVGAVGVLDATRYSAFLGEVADESLSYIGAVDFEGVVCKEYVCDIVVLDEGDHVFREVAAVYDDNFLEGAK